MSVPAGIVPGQQFRSKSSWAYETVRGMIWSGDLAAGASIDQVALAARLGISTTPLREALRRLEAEGYVLARDHKEARVAPPISFEAIEDLYAIRLLLDPFAAKLACEAATDAQVRSVQSLLPPEEGLSRLEYLTQSREFHRAIYSASGNPALTRVLDDLWDQCDRYRVGMLENIRMAAQARREHTQMCVLLAQRDSEGLAALMHRHLISSLERTRQSDSTLRLAETPADSDEAAAAGRPPAAAGAA